MGFASDVAGAISEGVNSLCALLAWNDAGAVEAPPVDSATLKKTIDALEEAMREILYGGKIVGPESLFTAEDIARLRRLDELIAAWPSSGALSPEVVTLASATVTTLCGGASWRELMTSAAGTVR